MRSQGEIASPGTAEAAAPGIAVLPFEVRGENLDMWREGMVDLLSVNLEGAADFRAIDSRTVLAGWREAVREAGTLELEGALDVARGTGAQYAVMGSVVSNGPDMRLGARIYSVQDGRSLASLTVEGPPDSLFTLVDRLSIDVLAAIWQGEERPNADVDLARITTTSLPALKAYLEGESLLRRADYEGAVAAYERAVAADSTFAFALFHLGLAYGWVGDGVQMVQSNERALRHASRLPEREAVLLRATLVESDVLTYIGLLREVTRKYPDDADAWYFLGDRYYHGGEQVALSTQDESERAFRKVVELDPGFAPAYVHLINNAFIHRPDSSRAAHLIDVYHRLSPNSLSDQENRIAFGLVFGDSARRGQAYAALDTLSPGGRLWLSDGFLDHPRFWDTRRVVLDYKRRSRTTSGPLLTVRLFDTNLSQGRLRAGLASLEDPLMFPGVRAAGLYAFHSAGLPVHGVALEEALALPRADSLPTDIQSTVILFHTGAYAADQGRWDDHAVAVARLRAQADRHLAAGDSGASRFSMGASLALQGQGLWRRGDAERALPLLTDGQRQTTWVVSATREALNGTIRWWLGELLLEMGRPLDAALYFESFWHDPRAAWQLGQIYEEVGDRAKARDAFAAVAYAWKDADPELQPQVREARAAVQRLSRLDR
jgi:tetratricopeptide (TPR) repeat protein